MRNASVPNVIRIGLAALSSFVVAIAATAAESAKGALDRSKFQIGAWRLQTWAQTEEHVKDLRDCGIDFVTGIRSKSTEDRMRVLDLFDKYGLYAVVTETLQDLDPFRGRFTEVTVPLSKYDRAAEIWKERGYAARRSSAMNYVGDEMKGTDFPHLGKVVAYQKRLLPGVTPYVNLYPSYAMPTFKPGMTNFQEIVRRRIGANNYREYIDLYCRYVPLDYISYDFYMYAPRNDTFLSFVYDNYQIVAEACRKTGRSFWFIPQVNSIRAEEWTSKNKLRFQAFSAMAYGCESIMWACYTSGWWTNQVVDATGAKTEQYGKLKSVNGEIRRLAETYMDFRNVDTAYVGFKRQPKALEKFVEDKAVESASFMPFADVRAADGDPLLVGQMMPRDTASCSRAIFLFAADDPYDKGCRQRKVLFKADDAKLRVIGPERDVVPTRLADGTYEVPIVSNEALLIVAE